jgi:cysteine desulfurase/selenocysteine lyase
LSLSWDEFRAEFPLVGEYAFLNHASVSPLPSCVRLAMDRHLEQCQYGPKYKDNLATSYTKARSAVSRLINASPDEIAFVQNTATGISLVANGLSLQPGDEVILVNMEYPANVYPWLNLRQNGVQVRILQHRNGGLDVGMLEAEVTDRTRVVAVSSVQFLSGYRADLAAIGAFCRPRDVYFVVDAIQSLGVIPMDVSAFRVDFLACGGWKWLLGPRGQAFLFCRQELIEQVRPILTGAGGVVNEDDYLTYDMTFVSTADRFHIGMSNSNGIIGLGAAAEMLMAIGIPQIEQRVLSLTDLMIDGLQQRGYAIYSNLEAAHRSGIVTFYVPKADALHAELTAKQVVTSCRWDANGKKHIRVSPHGYNNEEDITRFFEVLDSFQGR